MEKLSDEEIMDSNPYVNDWKKWYDGADFARNYYNAQIDNQEKRESELPTCTGCQKQINAQAKTMEELIEFFYRSEETEKQLAILSMICTILEADQIEYIDHGDRETYNITKNGRIIQIRVQGNNVDGAFAYFEILQ